MEEFDKGVLDVFFLEKYLAEAKCGKKLLD